MNENKIKIMSAASIIFSQKGYSGAGLSEIVEMASVPKGSFYYYFPNGKDQLVVETLWLAYETMMLKIKTDFLKNAHSPQELFEKMIDRLVSLVNKSHLESLLISLIGIETSRSNSMINEEVKKIYSKWQEEYKQMLLGFGLSEEKANQYRIVYFSLVHGALLSSYIKHDSSDLLITKEILDKFK